MLDRSELIERKYFGVLVLIEYAMPHSSMQTRASGWPMTFLHGAMIFLTS